MRKGKGEGGREGRKKEASKHWELLTDLPVSQGGRILGAVSVKVVKLKEYFWNRWLVLPGQELDINEYRTSWAFQSIKAAAISKINVNTGTDY